MMQRLRPAKVTVDVVVWDKLNKRYHQTKLPGRLFLIDGRHVKLYQPKVLAAAIDRTTQTLSNWTKSGRLPAPTFAVTDTQHKRWYSHAQVTMANKVWLKHRKSGQGKYFRTDPFLAEVRQHWHLDFVDTGVFDDGQEAKRQK